MRALVRGDTRGVVVLAMTCLVLGTFLTGASAQEPATTVSAGEARKPIRGRVVDENGRPVEGASVSANLFGSSGTFAGTVSGITNREGIFATTGLEPGLYRLWVQAAPLIVVDGVPERGARPGEDLTIRMARGAAISGKVLDRDGLPLTGLIVQPIRIRDGQGQRMADDYFGFRGGKVDDRGEFRLWGLEPGTYLLAAGHGASYDEEPKYLSDRVRTYHPSSNRADATEVSVRAGDDVGNVDITFRGETGFRISGVVTGLPGGRVSPNARVEVTHVGTRATERESTVNTTGDATTFRFESLEDGEYELIARTWDGEAQESSEPVVVRVRGADVNGVRLELRPTSTLAGRIELKPTKPDQACEMAAEGKAPPPLRLSEIAVRHRRVEAPHFRSGTIKVNADGEFVLKNMNGSKYRLSLDFADDDAYVESLDRSNAAGGATASTAARRSTSEPASTAAAVTSSIARDGLAVKRGDAVTGVRFVLARGAARVRGRIAPAKAGDPLPSRARVVLVPADAKQKDDVVHYYEVEVERDGSFDVRNVAPGEYFVATRVFPNDDRPDAEIFPASWDPKERATLRAAAEKLGVRVTLSPCQRLESAVVSLIP